MEVCGLSKAFLVGRGWTSHQIKSAMLEDLSGQQTDLYEPNSEGKYSPLDILWEEAYAALECLLKSKMNAWRCCRELWTC